jgi:hypothetical protein
MICELDTNKFSVLPFSEKLILWGIRTWVLSHKGQVGGHEMLQQGFKLAGVPDAHAALNDFMSVLACSAKTTIDIRCMKCDEVSVDEQRLLGVVANFQIGGNKDSGKHWLSIWLPPSATRIITQSAECLANALAHAELKIRLRNNVQPTRLRTIPLGVTNESIH